MKKLYIVVNKYKIRGFVITAVHGDNEFNVDDIKELLLPILAYIYGKGEHVGIIKRIIFVIKERCRCTCHSIPFEY